MDLPRGNPRGYFQQGIVFHTTLGVLLIGASNLYLKWYPSPVALQPLYFYNVGFKQRIRTSCEIKGDK